MGSLAEPFIGRVFCGGALAGNREPGPIRSRGWMVSSRDHRVKQCQRDMIALEADDFSLPRISRILRFMKRKKRD
jgi:hypothetical protein